MNRPRAPEIVLLVLWLSVLATAGCQQPPWGRSQTFLSGGRVPRSYFFAKASAESDEQPDVGCRDQAWVAAGLGTVNVVPGVSSLPIEAEEIDPPQRLSAGAMLDAAVAEISGAQGQRLTAAIRLARVRAKQTGESLGGLIVTYRGHADQAQALDRLEQSLQRAFARRYPQADSELANRRTIVESLTPKRKFGTVLVAVVFTDVIHPQTGGPTEWKPLREIVSE